MTRKELDARIQHLFVNGKIRDYIPLIKKEGMIIKSFTRAELEKKMIINGNMPVIYTNYQQNSWFGPVKQSEYFTIREYLIHYLNYTDESVDLLFEKIIFKCEL